ncbi:MAG: hypothetical protein ACRDK5_10700, partial [Solirubrobacterales bacterium]
PGSRDGQRLRAPGGAAAGHARRGVKRFRDGAFAPESFGKDVVAHYAEAGRWEWEQFLSPTAVGEWERRRYFDVI